MRAVLAVLTLLLPGALAGCINATDVAPAAALPEVSALTDVTAAVFGDKLLLGAPGAGLGVAGEPSVAVATDGTVYVAAPLIKRECRSPLNVMTGEGCGQGHLWRSDDGGATFTLLNDENGRLTPDDCGNGDTDVALTAQGDIHFVDLCSGVPYLVSRDRGETFTSGGILNHEDRPVDRQWIDAHGDAFVAAIWAAQDMGPRGITFTKSIDGGASWSKPADIVDGMIQLGPVDIAPNGVDVFVPYVTNVGHELRVLVSHDAGDTFTDVATGHTTPLPTVVPEAWSPTVIFPVAMADALGNVHLVWSEYRDDGGTTLFTMVSRDAGDSWSAPVALTDGTGNAVFPWLVIGDPGRIAVTYLASDLGGDPNKGVHEWHLMTAVSLDALADDPTWATGAVTPDAVHVGAVCPHGGGCRTRMLPVYGDRSVLDFFEAAVTPDGRLVVTWTHTNDDQTREARVVFAAQTGGSSLLAVPSG